MNIVSIDFDIIMAPSIEFYNHTNEKNREIIFQNSLMQNCSANLEIYHRLSQWLHKRAKILPSQNIIFIESHEKIIQYIPKNDNICLINIDHHHDTGYKDDQNIEINQINCGNWGKYLIENKLINSYIWVCNQNSNKYNYKYGAYTYINELNFNNLSADKIIICLSPEWIPPQYRHLFFNWLSTLSILKDTTYFLN